MKNLEHVITFLDHFPGEVKLQSKLGERGLKKYPSSVLLHLSAARTGFGGSDPVKCITIARDHLQQALKLAEASTRRDETLLVPKIKELLTVQDELFSRFAHGPFGPGASAGTASILKSFIQYMQSLPDDEDDDDDDEQEPSFGRASSSSPRTSPGSRRKRRSGP